MLPPDPDDMNDERADHAYEAILRFEYKADCDREVSLRDLLCNLMHWCDRHAKDFDDELKIARRHYASETALGDGEAIDLGSDQPEPAGL